MSASPGATDETENTEHSVVPEAHRQAEQDALPDLVAPQGVNEGSGREDDAQTGDTIGASEPGEASSTVKDPSEWVTGDEAMPAPSAAISRRWPGRRASSCRPT